MSGTQLNVSQSVVEVAATNTEPQLNVSQMVLGILAETSTINVSQLVLLTIAQKTVIYCWARQINNPGVFAVTAVVEN